MSDAIISLQPTNESSTAQNTFHYQYSIRIKNARPSDGDFSKDTNGATFLLIINNGHFTISQFNRLKFERPPDHIFASFKSSRSISRECLIDSYRIIFRTLKKY